MEATTEGGPMSERGVFAVDRGIWDHPIFKAERFTEREAWLWLVGEACWKAKRVRVGKGMFELERGQLAYATRFMAVRWRWSDSHVRRFLKRLESDAMIGTLATHNATIITICNYDKFAFGRRADDAQPDAQTGEQPTRSRRKEEEGKKDKKEETSERARASRGSRLLPDWRPSDDDWKAACSLLGPHEAGTELLKFRDYWRAKAGAGGVKLDWDATWRNWIRNARPSGGGRNGSKQQSFAELHAELSNSNGENHDESPGFTEFDGPTFDLEPSRVAGRG